MQIKLKEMLLYAISAWVRQEAQLQNPNNYTILAD